MKFQFALENRQGDLLDLSTKFDISNQSEIHKNLNNFLSMQVLGDGDIIRIMADGKEKHEQV
jgi:hypothetical protein